MQGHIPKFSKLGGARAPAGPPLSPPLVGERQAAASWGHGGGRRRRAVLTDDEDDESVGKKDCCACREYIKDVSEK
jgi:hypothetical protein